MMLRYVLQTVRHRKAGFSEPSSHCCARPPSSPPAAPSAVLPVAYAAVVGLAGLLALAATAIPGRAALRAAPVEVATAKG